MKYALGDSQDSSAFSDMFSSSETCLPSQISASQANLAAQPQIKVRVLFMTPNMEDVFGLGQLQKLTVPGSLAFGIV